MFKEKDKEENLYHTALILGKKIKLGTPKANIELRKLLQEYGSFKEIYRSFYPLMNSSEDLECIHGIENVKREIEGAGEYRTITINDKEFPSRLKNVEDAVPALYTKGNLDIFNEKTMAVVGTREIYPGKNDLEIKEANEFLEGLLDKKYAIVSGLANGSDTIAHKYAIEHGGKTIAVIGTSLSKSYPQENKGLQAKIAEEHLLVSEYPIGAYVYNSFPLRDKTIASLSEGVVVIKAGDKSGTIHTVREAVKQGKKIYVLKNNFFEKHEWLTKYKENIEEA